jgi:transcriptional regulator with XRE-family HTH domain
MDMVNAMGKRFNLVREMLGMSREDMAEALRCTDGDVILLEAGRYPLDSEQMETIRERFGVNEAYLMNGDMPMFRKAPTSKVEAGGCCDLVLTLAHLALEHGRDMTEGEAYVPHDPKCERIERDIEFEKCVEEYAEGNREAYSEIVDKANLLQGAVEVARFVAGMRYGARLMLSLLSGTRGLYAS